MRRAARKKRVGMYYLTGITIVVSSLLGTSYAYWTDELVVQGTISTGNIGAEIKDDVPIVITVQGGFITTGDVSIRIENTGSVPIRWIGYKGFTKTIDQTNDSTLEEDQGLITLFDGEISISDGPIELDVTEVISNMLPVAIGEHTITLYAALTDPDEYTEGTEGVYKGMENPEGWYTEVELLINIQEPEPIENPVNPQEPLLALTLDAGQQEVRQHDEVE